MNRQFSVQKDDGSNWLMTFTSSGVRWDPTGSGSDLTPTPSSPSLGGAASEITSPLRSGLNTVTAINGVQAIAQVGQTAAMIGMWWEDHQRRLFDEARHDEFRRIAWLGDMTARWASAHQAGDQLNLRVTEHLAREAKETMNALLSNKRVAIPQSVLCDLGEIQDTLGSFRSLMLAQFEELAADRGIDLDEAVREALPGRRLNMEYIRLLGQDPAAALEALLRTRSKSGFDQEFSESLISAGGFTDRVFPSTLPAISEPPEKHGLVTQLIEAITAALPNLPGDDVNPEAVERRTTFRELTLLPAEVLRVRALNTAWLATSAVIARATGRELEVQLSAQGVAVALSVPAARPELPTGGGTTEQPAIRA